MTSLLRSSCILLFCGHIESDILQSSSSVMSEKGGPGPLVTGTLGGGKLGVGAGGKGRAQWEEMDSF